MHVNVFFPGDAIARKLDEALGNHYLPDEGLYKSSCKCFDEGLAQKVPTPFIKIGSSLKGWENKKIKNKVVMESAHYYSSMK